ncbi:MAG TPA: cell division protein ZipA C-terminal FtsZ-binding domain-containing protein [Steroidobacteraceae bacterium]|nr:cell division protein ZipA C-terminal FtsZ-binding domain-containing protein [Steroidobacteraceae bacterium]
MSELRWALLILGVVFFAALAVWELRRPRQARGSESGAQLPLAPGPPPHEPLAQEALAAERDFELPEMHAHEPLAARGLPIVELPEDREDLAEDSLDLPVLTPAPGTVAAAEDSPPDYETAQEADEPQLADVEAAGEGAAAALPDAAAEVAVEIATADTAADFVQPAADAPASVAPPAALSGLPELPAAPAPRVEWPPDAERQVVALRLVATQPERFAGRSLRQALAAEGFVLGRFDIFHKADDERRAILSAASLNRPGTFDSDTMDSQHFGGLSLFAVLPGPMSPPQAFEELVSTARSLNDRLCGVLQDEAGVPLTPSRIATLRERLSSGVPS